MRLPAVSALVAVALVGVLAGAAGHIRAQDATPPSAQANPHVVGLTLTDLGSGLPTGAPGQALHLMRVVQEPGGYIDPHRHPGGQVFYVDQGTVGFSVYSGQVRLVRATDQAGAEGELVPEGTEVILKPGDWLYYGQDVVESARNAGDSQAVILIAALYYTGFPMTIFAEGVPPIGTPAS
jgi:quercetin dioxygenase-like cupin family protein